MLVGSCSFKLKKSEKQLSTINFQSNYQPSTINYRLAIVSFDIPYPADYGGVIDVFYKIKALHDLDVEITLHCFEYGDRKPQKELEKYCKKVFYYKRGRSIFQQLTLTPFIVSTRKKKELLKNLQIDDAPILFEGLHTCDFINHPILKDRKKYVRMHNIEWQYYSNLAVSEKNIFKRIFFSIESWRLKLFEKKIIPHTEKIFFISHDDEKYFLDKYKNENPNSEVIYPFHNYELKFTERNDKKYFFFHGNLSVSENENALRIIINNLFYNRSSIRFPLVIAGKSPAESFHNYLIKLENIILIGKSNDEQISNLSRESCAHILFVEKSAGVKLKLIRSLAENKNCFVHINVLPDLSWSKYCNIFSDWDELRKTLHDFNFENENTDMLEKRKILFKTILNNEENAKKIVATLRQ